MAITSIKTGSSFTNLIKYDSFLAGNAAVVSYSYESISTVTVGNAGSSLITFSSIPATYKHLQIRGIARTTRAATQDEYKINFNSSTSGYARHSIVSYGTGTEATGFYAQDHWRAGWSAGGTLVANGFGSAIFDIFDYTNTNKYKTSRALSFYDGNGNGNVGFASGLWQSFDAITQIDISPAFNPFVEYTQFALYGIKG